MRRLSKDGWPRRLLSRLIWPGIYAGGLFGTFVALTTDRPVLWFNVLYLLAAVTIGVFERLMPHEERWLEPDHETLTNLAHTFLSKGLAVLSAALISSFAILASFAAEPSFRGPDAPWPQHWPLAVQVLVALFVAELGLYVAHRAAHYRMSLWRFHALHHSVERLWVINTGRFHLVDSLWKVTLSQMPLYLLGAPLPVFVWISAVTAFTGLLTHCNIELRTGPLDYVFATPALHRWHHSKVLDEGNRNFGENVVLWDLLFGTYFNPARRPPADIGIHGRVARGFPRQFVQPFTRSGVRAILGE